MQTQEFAPGSAARLIADRAYAVDWLFTMLGLGLVSLTPPQFKW